MLKLIKDLGRQYPTLRSKYKTRFGIYVCPACKESFRAMTSNVNSRNTTKCNTCASKANATTHGASKTRLYTTWAGMKDRCLNTQCQNFARYGGRGISVWDSWQKSFESFQEWALDSGYTDGLEIDRINNEGNYEPSNCRWTTRFIQAQNTKRIQSNNTSGYRGVVWHKVNKNWVAKIGVKGRKVYLGSFPDKVMAALAYDAFIYENKLEHTRNFT